jgi:type I restriction enzyme R subunit
MEQRSEPTVNTSQRHTEGTFEKAIVDSLVTDGGYRLGNRDHFDKDLALDVPTVIEFLQVTQKEAWDKISGIHRDRTDVNVISRLVKEMELRGSLDVIRNGFTDYGIHFRMATFKPETTLNESSRKLYDANILTVSRQVKYSQKNDNSLDLVLFLNGIPVATAELKNQLTGQDAENAKRQYRYDRDVSEPIFRFKQRSLVHFVVDTSDVYTTTRLNGPKTHYLPFNLGFNRGAGNPANPNGYRTSYLWEYVWSKDSWLDIIGKFLHLQVEEEELGGKKIRKETMIFPRYHQLDVVRKLSEDARHRGPGENYLIQHSAGSGKSNSIAWLAYRLANLHNQKDERVFSSVIVITDRRVLDNQLQNTIYQFEHKMGVVEKIDKDSTQLADAIRKGVSIIITTLQKFPVILGKIGELPNRNYAVIVDEAHSSQSGEANRKMKEVLSAVTLEDAASEESDQEEEDNYEDALRKTMLSRGKQKNLSFFAFTATPKAKTIEVFGTPGPDGRPGPFHLYSMRQAIEEGFIMDVLKGYTTYKTYYRLNKQAIDDPRIPKKKGAIAAARFVSFHPHHLAQKTEVIIEHFRRVTRAMIGGKAKAMVVTSSRLHAVKYKQEFDRYIREKGYSDLRTLVAFSGTVRTDGIDYTEPQMNGFGEKELPAKFSTQEYGVLIVAEKYQTGFDQPLLHTMYVDKKLSGVKAVQTLSRLNRICPGKENTFVLDFANETEDIQYSFQPFYERTTIESNTDPNHIYDLKHQLEKAQVIWLTEMESFCKVYFDPGFSPRDQGRLNAFLDPAVDRFNHLPTVAEEDESAPSNKDDFKNTIQVFIRFYNFITQVVSFGDLELEKFYTYCRFLERKLPALNLSEQFKLSGDELALEYYRLQVVTENTDIPLKKETGTLNTLSEAGMRRSKEEKSALSEIIRTVNERFGTEFTEADRLLIDQVIEDYVADEDIASQARSNTIENFKFGFDDAFLGKWIDRMDQNKELFAKVLDDDQFSGYLRNVIMNEVYRRLRQ